MGVEAPAAVEVELLEQPLHFPREEFLIPEQSLQVVRTRGFEFGTAQAGIMDY